MAASDSAPDPAQVRIVTASPLNAETPLASLVEPIQEAGRLYVRSNFPTPSLPAASYRLELVGLDGDARMLDLDELRSLAPQTRTVTLECAGNGRTLLDPQPEGTAWTLGGTGTASFTGVPLTTLLPDLAGTVEVLFTGADHGPAGDWGDIPFQRSLPVEVLANDLPPMVVWGMNGHDLPAEHGGPVRLIVPGWYAVASVKWLTRIDLLRTPFEGYFQTDRYRYLTPGEAPSPVRRMRPRALALRVGDTLLEAEGPGLPDATHPLELRAGPLQLEGIAWTGHGAIDLVEVSVDGGITWTAAEVDPEPAPHVRSLWRAQVELTAGASELVIRAQDSEGNIQPLRSFWNSLGYGNNEVQRIPYAAG